MGSISASFAPETSTVTVTVSSTSDTWRGVRRDDGTYLRPRTAPSFAGTTIVLQDYTAPAGGRTYVVESSTGVALASYGPVPVEHEAAWISDAAFPGTRYRVPLVLGLSVAGPTTGAVIDVLDAPSPVVLRGVQRTPRGRFQALVDTLSDGIAVHQLHDGRELHLLHPLPALSMTYVPEPSGATLAPADAAGSAWTLEIPYVSLQS